MDIHNNRENYISSSIKSNNLNGLYELQVDIQIHDDSGPNYSVTNLISLLHNFKVIDLSPIAGVNSNSPAIFCTGFGYLR